MSAVKYFIEQNTKRLMIDEFLQRELNSAGYGGVDIRKMPMRTEMVIHASRPGVVIGRRGSKIRALSEVLESDFAIDNVQVEVNEIENPWLNANVMASRLARQLERGIRYRRMAYWILRRVMRAGAVGCEIIIKGKLSSRRARYQKFKKGTIAKTGEPASVFVDEADDTAVLKPGVIGIKVRIMRPDARLPGVIGIHKPKPKEVKAPTVAAEPVEEKEEPSDAETVEEELEGITDIDELRELEELDGLELVEEEPEPDEPDSAEEAPAKEAAEKTEDESKSEDTEELSEERRKELEALDELDTGGD